MKTTRYIFLFTCIIALACRVVAEEEELSNFEKFQQLRAMEQEAQNYIIEKEYKAAAKLFIKIAEAETQRPKQAAYRLKAADAYFNAKKGRDALHQYKILLENYPLYVPYDHVVDKLRQLAEQFVTGEATFLSLSDEKGAIQIYELIIREAPAVHMSSKDRFRLAELLLEDDRPEEAVAVYQAIIKIDSRSWDARAKLALLLAKLSKTSDGDGTKIRAAMREAKLVLKYAPDHELAPQLKLMMALAQESLASRLLKQAEFYLSKVHKRPSAARRYLHDIITNYPESNAAKHAQELLKNNPELAKLEAENKDSGTDKEAEK